MGKTPSGNKDVFFFFRSPAPGFPSARIFVVVPAYQIMQSRKNAPTQYWGAQPLLILFGQFGKRSRNHTCLHILS